jgi:hypothetical protein
MNQYLSARIPLRQSQESGGKHEVSTQSTEAGHMVGIACAFGVGGFDVHPGPGNTSAQPLHILDRGDRADNNVARHQAARYVVPAVLSVEISDPRNRYRALSA